MKKTILSILTFIAIGTSVNAQNVNIPDANFKTYLVGNTAINTNSDTEIQLSEASAFTGNVNCQNLNISDLTGIEAFTYINYLYCNDNQLANLDISNCEDLLGLRCHNNQLTSLDLSNNIYLTEIYCYANNLTNLDVLNLTDLETFRGQTNQISSLDFSGASNLIFVKCGYNNLSYLNVANGNNANMPSFQAHSNPSLTCIEVDDVAYSTTNWTFIDPASSFSTNCPPPPCTVTIPDANFKAYLVGNAAINTNGDSEIQCSEASAFNGSMNCDALSISDLTGIETFTSLTQLDCSNNSLTTLDLSQNTALNFLQSNNNSLTDLDLSQNPEITGVFCYNNSLTTLDLNQNMPLTILNCQTNQLTSLDISGFASLTVLYCGSNQLTDLNVANGNNINMVASLDPGLIAMNNPNLICIQIDAGYTPNSTDWHVDAIASFSTNCAGTAGINEFNSQNISIYPNPVNNKLFVEVENQQVTEMVIIDYSGRVVQSISNNNTNSIDVSELKGGIYILKVSTDKGISTNRFIKQ